ncbi:fatty acid desaturase-domain-containing protein [Pelagophyceae sp. CCMP2097]|nr:fatty acid desaturase-domain-containing protein [Pelagophyceae sp. CCMP2097]|mmetsp:Transcript_22859/g.78228  ORF Transcript_22859/g.78228 Transcript_22859/m.78228 type:complete len:477 (+) Transcript_22859:123-1553(+)|eukprot:CAMPEP_0184083876 /NCGR_PEP_ID=MMETSP0974-20121125/3926_1 /TAXON_ID=483370 /ORGANISM="non described non described, Strain CCMP2097" /LENGTH=476 /DNA_ID=CAMNT_0026386553 /DNA_START=105 /DNA_END=1535 /DNA_ORIENTATION=+
MGKGGERPPAALNAETVELSWSEVTKHRSPNDAWMVCNSKVYDVSGWHEHPGGDVIFTAAGDDATDSFALFHGAGTSKHLDQFLIGKLDEKSRKQWSSEKPKSEAQLEFEKGYRALRRELKRLGMFESSPMYYAYKMATTLMLAITAAAMVVTLAPVQTKAAFVARALVAPTLLGLFFQQCGWLCHEIVHHQVFSDRTVGHWVGYFWGNVAQGFSVSWWKNKHNTHHAVPNVHATGADAQNGDPDIDTMPFLAWSKPMLKLAQGAFSRFMVSNQHVIYFPLLAFARFSWLQQSFAYVANLDDTAGRKVKGTDNELKPVAHEKFEVFLLGLHYAWYFAVIAQLPSFAEGLLFFLVSNVACGLMLAFVFSLGHNGMAVYDAAERPDYWKLQVTTTRNILQDRFGLVHWFCGGLDYQVEHHLFPTIPRHNLGKTRELCLEFCAKNNVSYHETDFWTGTVEVLACLKDLAEDFVRDFPAM